MGVSQGLIALELLDAGTCHIRGATCDVCGAGESPGNDPTGCPRMEAKFRSQIPCGQKLNRLIRSHGGNGSRLTHPLATWDVYLVESPHTYQEGKNMDWSEIPEVLWRFDAKRYPRCAEAVIMQVVWCALSAFPRLPGLLGHPDAAVWRLGGHGEGDLVGTASLSAPADVLVHLEGKSAGAAESYGGKCRQRCGRRQSQIAHMAHDEADIIILTHTWRRPDIERWAVAATGPDRVRVLSYAEFADLVEAALVDGEPPGSLLADLLDVEAA